MLNEIGALFSARLLAMLRDTALLLIFLNAYLSHAPTELPGSLRQLPQWLWSWNLAALRAFVSSKVPGLQASHTETIESPDLKKTTVDSVVQPSATPTKEQST